MIKHFKIILQGETGENWGGLGHLFSNEELEETIYTFCGYLPEYEDGIPYFENMEKLITGIEFSFIGINIHKLCLENNGKFDSNPRELSYWFSSKSDVIKVINIIKKRLENDGCIVTVDISER